MNNGLYYLDKLSKADQVRFLRNLSTIDSAVVGGYIPTISEYLLKEHLSFERFLVESFIWSSSPEGLDYWSDKAFV